MSRQHPPRVWGGGGSCEGAQGVRASSAATGSPLLCAVRTQLDGDEVW